MQGKVQWQNQQWAEISYFWDVKTIPIWQIAEIEEKKGSAATEDQELKELWGR